ncbi:hypothetical protein QBC38DRAFT_27450 [Podospora fimiseda]|uniref:Uncharacterized protein n=1 Tax=Podospora fimiseda TaxID=252190 RepID=A0AAN7GPQ1_9PEZI|nr:hypothetical protein QBC38DRAFT_27450 [Podospora fimiseda]
MMEKSPSSAITSSWSPSESAIPTPVSPVCEICQSFLLRPDIDANSQQHDNFKDKRFSVHLGSLDASRSAANGCVLCKQVMAVQLGRIKHGFTESTDLLMSFELTLVWCKLSENFRAMSSMPLSPSIQLYLIDHEKNKTIKHPSPLNTASQICKNLATGWIQECLLRSCQMPAAIPSTR